MKFREHAVYLPPPKEASPWDAIVTSVGRMTTRPGESYPPRGTWHPSDHSFSRENGRVLDCWQVVVIHDGEGWFESDPTGRCHVRAGSTFLVFPGVRHRYQPDPRAGWVESWIEIDGNMPGALQKRGLLQPAHALHHHGDDPDFLDAVERCLSLASGGSVRSGAILSATALEVLAHWMALREGTKPVPGRMDILVRRARGLLAGEGGFHRSIQSVAGELSVAPSHLRRTFKAQTGLSPKQYQLDLRMRRVRSLLRNSVLSISEIADQLDYHSPFHLSAEFKKHHGESPSAWRSHGQ